MHKVLVDVVVVVLDIVSSRITFVSKHTNCVQSMFYFSLCLVISFNSFTLTRTQPLSSILSLPNVASAPKKELAHSLNKNRKRVR